MKEIHHGRWLRSMILIILCWTLTIVSVPCSAAGAGNADQKDGKLEVYFIDVGQADAALVLCDGQSMLIDGGNAADSSKMYSVMKKHGISQLDYVIGTHAHEDHIGGLAGALNYSSVKFAYCPVTSYDSKAFQNFRTAVEKYGVSITVPKDGDTFSLGSAECEILAVNTGGDTNNSSIVLRIAYGDTSFLFTGDAEREVEQAILNGKKDIQSTVLKVGHHGSESSTSYLWLREVMPQYAVISVGKDNSYGHPTDEVLSRLRDAEVTTFRTDMQGDISCVSDGKTVEFTVSRNRDADVFASVGTNSTQRAAQSNPTEPTAKSEPVGQTYILNTNTKKFHIPTCRSVKQMKDKNKKDFCGSREEVIAKGYSPCKNCNP